jgi:mannose-6-phosphate isomerase-like protein (cupin superfamily)
MVIACWRCLDFHPARMTTLPGMRVALLAFLTMAGLLAREPLADRIVHTDPTKYRVSPRVHGGPGQLNYMSLFDFHNLDTNLYFLHRGVIEPKSGIGHHFHNNCEEMFVIFDGEAQFTIDGRTALLKGPAGAPTRMGHSHAIYNPTDRPVQWMNINVSAIKGEYDAFDLADGRVDVALDKIPTFMTMKLDRGLLRPVEAMNGGKGTVQYRRALAPSVFAGPWSYVDHLVLPPATATGPHSHRGVAEFYYVMSGEGVAKISSRGQNESAPIRSGDAIPIQLGEVHAFENNGTQPLEFMIVGVSRDMRKEIDTVEGTGGRRGN